MIHFARIALYAVIAIFSLTGLLNLGGEGHLTAVYRLWRYPHHFNRIVGLAELLTALFLILPETRVWGIAAAGIMAFITVITLLHHRLYAWSLPVMLLLISLVPASLARL